MQVQAVVLDKPEPPARPGICIEAAELSGPCPSGYRYAGRMPRLWHRPRLSHGPSHGPHPACLAMKGAGIIEPVGCEVTQ